MSPQELLAKGIAENNMDLIKEANELLQAPVVKKPRGRPKSNVVKGKNIGAKKTKAPKPAKSSKSPKSPKKKKGGQSDIGFIEQLYQIEHDRRVAIRNGSAGTLVGQKPVALDNKKEFVEDQRIDKLLGKNKRNRPARRQSVHMVKTNCPRCHKAVEVLSTDMGQFSFDSGDENSMLPLYSCGCR